MRMHQVLCYLPGPLPLAAEKSWSTSLLIISKLPESSCLISVAVALRRLRFNYSTVSIPNTRLINKSTKTENETKKERNDKISTIQLNRNRIKQATTMEIDKNSVQLKR